VGVEKWITLRGPGVRRSAPILVFSLPVRRKKIYSEGSVHTRGQVIHTRNMTPNVVLNDRPGSPQGTVGAAQAAIAPAAA
jgi:hypothetical protein